MKEVLMGQAKVRGQSEGVGGGQSTQPTAMNPRFKSSFLDHFLNL